MLTKSNTVSFTDKTLNSYSNKLHALYTIFPFFFFFTLIAILKTHMPQVIIWKIDKLAGHT